MKSKLQKVFRGVGVFILMALSISGVGQAVHVNHLQDESVSDFIYGIDQGIDGLIYVATDNGLVS